MKIQATSGLRKAAKIPGLAIFVAFVCRNLINKLYYPVTNIPTAHSFDCLCLGVLSVKSCALIYSPILTQVAATRSLTSLDMTQFSRRLKTNLEIVILVCKN